MDYDDFRSIVESSGVDLWSFIDTAISVASSDYADELKHRRDGIVEKLYSSTWCRNCDGERNVQEMKASEVEKEASPQRKGRGSPSTTPQSNHVIEEEEEEEEEDQDRRYGGLFDDEETKILAIIEHLEDPDQSEESVVELLQTLADMDITFKALKETDIGRHVNRLRKHSSKEVRDLVKHLVSKWKILVDEWVKMNPNTHGSTVTADGDSPHHKFSQNGHHQVTDFAYSPNPHNGSSGSDKNYAELEPKGKAVLRREVPKKPAQSTPVPAYVPPYVPVPIKPREPKVDAERLASARKRLQENYKEAENAKKQRTIQVMDIHDLPKPKNTFFAKNKGNSHGRH